MNLGKNKKQTNFIYINAAKSENYVQTMFNNFAGFLTEFEKIKHPTSKVKCHQGSQWIFYYKSQLHYC